MKTALIHLDGKTSSTLNWTSARKEALQQIAQGKKILWHLDLGCFQSLLKPLENQEQFMALTLAIEHFSHSLWNEFRTYSKGLLLYKGSAHFSLEARNIASDYLQQLIAKLPDPITPYIAFDADAEDPLMTELVHDPSAYGRFKILSDAHDWNPESSQSTGVLMPPVTCTDINQLDPYRNLSQKISGSFKKIPESQLISYWPGLDRLYYVEGVLSPHGRRQIQGFLAAGGEVIAL